MKAILITLLLAAATTATSQPTLPDFLAGTWKMEGKEMYEHWDKLNENHFKGVSYAMKNGKVRIMEYLEISRSGNEVNYAANALGQNDGKAIPFKLTKSDSVYVFENPSHDFPKKISYRLLSPGEMFVDVRGDEGRGFSYKMTLQNQTAQKTDSTNANPNYDAALAKKLGADDYGMKKFVLVMLKTGSNKTTDRSFIDSCFRGHMENINRLVEEGRLVVAGPMGKNDKTYRGIFILDVPTIEEAEKLLQTDPAVSGKLLAAELYVWYGSAALREYLEASDKVWKRQP